MEDKFSIEENFRDLCELVRRQFGVDSVKLSFDKLYNNPINFTFNSCIPQLIIKKQYDS